MNKKLKINQFQLPEGNMIVRTRHSKNKFVKLLKTNRLSFMNYRELNTINLEDL